MKSQNNSSRKRKILRALSIITALTMFLTACGGSKTGSGNAAGNGNNSGNAGTAGSASASESKDFQSAEIFLDTNILLAGTESCFRVQADEWILSYGQDLAISSSDESVMTVEKDAKHEAMIIKGVSAGTATLTVNAGSATDSKEIRVVASPDGNIGDLELSSDTIDLISMENVDFKATLKNLPSEIQHCGANIYHSREIFTTAKGEWAGQDLNLSIYTLSAKGKKGTIYIVFTDQDNPDTVVASAAVPAEVKG